MPFIGNTHKTILPTSTIDHQKLLGSNADTTTNAGYSTFYVRYSPGNVSVIVNGTYLMADAYVAENGTDVRIATTTLTIAPTDQIEIIGYNLPISNILERTDVHIVGGKIAGIDVADFANILDRLQALEDQVATLTGS
ncbi:MAG: hypothetical protein VW270_00085 [Candidatus Poseidoniales archaeon]